MSDLLKRAIESGLVALKRERRAGDGSLGFWGPDGPPMFRITATAVASEALGVCDLPSECFLREQLKSAPPMSRFLSWALNCPASSQFQGETRDRLLALELPTGGWGHATREYSALRGRPHLAAADVLPTFLACRALMPHKNVTAVYGAVERAADWIQARIASEGTQSDLIRRYDASATAFILCVLVWGQTHRVQNRDLSRLSARLRQWVDERQYQEELVPDAGRELDTPYTIFTPVWVCYALLEDIRRENHRSIVQLARHILKLQKADGSFTRHEGGAEHDVYSTAQAVLLLKRVQNYLDSDLARDCVLTSEDRQPISRNEHLPDVDVAILCAVDIEWQQLIQASPDLNWEKAPIQDTIDFYRAKLTTTSGHVLRLLAVKAGRTGMTSAAALTSKVILRFSPKLVCMVGIAAGTRSPERGYGDVLIASPAFDYTSGKWREQGSLFRRRLHLDPDPDPVQLPEVLRNRIDSCRFKYVEAIRQAWKGGALPTSPLRVHLGPMASGNAVVAARTVGESIKKTWRKLVGIEMETYGVYRAAHDTVHPPPLFLACKSVCDYADDEKGDNWQAWAAFTSAMFMMCVLKNDVDDLLGD